MGGARRGGGSGGRACGGDHGRDADYAYWGPTAGRRATAPNPVGDDQAQERGGPGGAAQRGRHHPGRGAAVSAAGAGRGGARVMRLSSISVRIESGDNVDVHYAPARVTRFSDGYEMPVPPMAHVYVGEVHLFGPPAAVDVRHEIGRAHV